MVETIIFLLLLICMWPFVSAAKISECIEHYPSGKVFMSVTGLTLLGFAAWAYALWAGSDALAQSGTLLVADWSFWGSLLSYLVTGVVRYSAFSRYEEERMHGLHVLGPNEK
ncbi:hypothetical protein K8R03_00230 [Candidatus Kaiserbacteria bacterium]|nr:hypothetical protein [Candidatus Kaiserbacteria bacterium]